MKEIKIDIKTEHIQALLEGKKLTYDISGLPRITLYPERYGIFLTVDKYADLRRKLAMGIMADPDTVFKEVFGDELWEKVIELRDRKHQ